MLQPAAAVLTIASKQRCFRSGRRKRDELYIRSELKAGSVSDPHTMHEHDPSGHLEGLTSGDFTASNEPFQLFQTWFSEAQASEINDPNAMSLATVDSHGMPDARIVLLKGFDNSGFVFYTNSESAKGQELAANPNAALVFHWKSLRRQIRVRGSVEIVPAAEADSYFVTRPRQSRVGAWASQQSRPLDTRATFEAAYADANRLYPDEEIPRPLHWNGYRLTPTSIEFWHDRPFRMHDRIVFSRANPGEDWQKARLYP